MRTRRAPKFQLGDRGLEAMRQAEMQRYDVPARPSGAIPEIPDDITDLDDRDLIGLMTQFTRWAEHLGVQTAMAEVDERWAEAEMEKEKALASLGSVKDVTERKAKAYESEAFIESQGRYHERMAYRKLVAVLYNNTVQWSALLSRELTRRTNLAPQMRRTDRNTA